MTRYLIALAIGVIVAAVAIFAIRPAREAPGLEVSEAWTRPVAAGLNGAVYMTLTNRGDRPIRIVRAETDAAARLEMHRSEIETTQSESGIPSQVMTMRQVDSLEVPPGGSLALTPGGTHLMAVEVREGLAEGDVIVVTLYTDSEDLGPLTVEVPVGDGPADLQNVAHQH